MTAEALVDSNVIIAALAEAHEHHVPSLSLFVGEGMPRFAVSAHSHAEAYVTLTRRSDHAPFRFTAEEAWSALESVAAVTDLIGLTPAQTFASIGVFARHGGIGARLYDRLIGEAAIANGLPAIVTWNTSHLRGLFPSIAVVTPREFAKRGSHPLPGGERAG